MNNKITALSAFVAVLGGSAYGQYAAYTYGSGGTFNAFPNAYQVNFGGVGFRFQAMNSGVVTNISAAVANYAAGSGLPVTFELWTDNGAGSPTGTLGTLLAPGWTTSTSGQPYNVAPALSVNVTGGPMVTAGNWYWLTGSASGGGYVLDWAESPLYSNPNGYVLETNVITPDPANTGAYSISVKAVPEPSSYAALGLGVVGLIVRRKRR